MTRRLIASYASRRAGRRAALTAGIWLLVSTAPTLAATSAYVTDAQLIVEGSGANDEITIVLPPTGTGPGTYSIRDPAGVVAGPGCTLDAADASRMSCTTPQADATIGGQTTSGTVVSGLAGDDKLRAVLPADPASDPHCAGPAMYGDDGADDLTGSDCKDYLDGGAGSDTLRGGSGADTLIPGGRTAAGLNGLFADGPDTVDGGPGDPGSGFAGGDTVSYADRGDGLHLDLTVTTDWGAVGENDSVSGVENVLGGHDHDHIVGAPGPNLLVGDPAGSTASYGTDLINALDGDGADTIDCGPGNDDGVIADHADSATNCESRQGPPPEPSVVCVAGSGAARLRHSCGPAPVCETLPQDQRSTMACYDPPCGGATQRPARGEPCVPITEQAGNPSPPGGCASAASGNRVVRCHISHSPVRVKSNGSFSLPRVRILRSATVKTVVLGRTSPVVLGKHRYTVTSAGGAVRGRLSSSGLRHLKRHGKIAARVRVTATHVTATRGTLVSTRVIRVTLRAPSRR